MEVRPERPGDEDAIRKVHESAFPTESEANIVDALRRNGNLTVSLVAQREDEILGHIAFSPVECTGSAAQLDGLGLAPVAVMDGHQRRGIGKRLIEAGLAAAWDTGADYVAVLGDPNYYTRFGFGPAMNRGLASEYGFGPEFMVMEREAALIPAGGGLVVYSGEFGAG